MTLELYIKKNSEVGLQIVYFMLDKLDSKSEISRSHSWTIIFGHSNKIKLLSVFLRAVGSIWIMEPQSTNKRPTPAVNSPVTSQCTMADREIAEYTDLFESYKRV